VARNYRVTELPIEYDERAGETKLDPFRGGMAIAKSIVRVGLEERLGTSLDSVASTDTVERT
jgi:hypothetical protein